MLQYFDKTDRGVFYIIFFPGYFSAFMRVLVLFQSAITTVFGTYYSARATNNNVWTLGSKGLDKNVIQPYFFLFWMNSTIETEWFLQNRLQCYSLKWPLITWKIFWVFQIMMCSPLASTFLKKMGEQFLFSLVFLKWLFKVPLECLQLGGTEHCSVNSDVCCLGLTCWEHCCIFLRYVTIFPFLFANKRCPDVVKMWHYTTF